MFIESINNMESRMVLRSVMRLSAIIVYLLLFASLNAEVITIGYDNYLNQGLPIEPVARFTYSQQLFLPSEIGCSGLIASVAFQYNVVSNLFYNGNKNWKIWMGHTSLAELETWIPVNEMQVVFDNIIPESAFTNGLPGTGWLIINLEEPFYYNGMDALIISVDENSFDSGSTTDDFFCSFCPYHYAIQYLHNTINPDPNAPPETGWTLKNYRSNIQLFIEAQYYAPIQPFPADGAVNIALDTNLSWVSSCSSFSLFLGTHPDSLIQVINHTPNNYWQPDNPFLYHKTYYWQVIGYTNEIEYPSAVWIFSTITEQISPPQNLTGVYNGYAAELNWNPPQTNNQHHYRLYRNASFYATTTNSSYCDDHIQAGQSYYYYVTAVSNSGEESYPSNLITVTIPSQETEQILFQGFENIPAFTEDIISWQNWDLDGNATSEWEGISYPNETNPLGWLCFEPLATNPPLHNHLPYAGNKMLASICAIPPPNNDWLISPAIHLGTNSRLNFVARSAFANFGLERLCVLISNTTSEIHSFTTLNSGSYISVPVQWTNYEYDLSAWDGQRIFLAWRCLSVDAMALFLDNIEVYSNSGWVSNLDILAPQTTIKSYPNPCKGTFILESNITDAFNLEIYNLKGQCLYKERGLKSFDSKRMNSDLANGIYVLKISQGGKVITIKQTVVK